MIDQDFLRDEEHPASRFEPLDIERPIRFAELHQVDAGQVASRVVQEHVLAARIAGIDPAGIGTRVPAIDRRVVLDARIAAGPSALGHPIQQMTRLVGWRLAAHVASHPARGPLPAFLDRIHEFVGHAD
jgi:hypothetical protein